MMAQNSTLIIREWNGRTIRQRKEDEYWSATDMCQSCGKKFGHWNELKSTAEHLRVLESAIGKTRAELIEIKEGGVPSEQGTWVHRRVAIRLAQWLSPEFAVQIDEWVEELMINGKVVLVDKNAISELESAEKQLDIAERMMGAMNIDPSLIMQAKLQAAKRLFPAATPMLDVGIKAISSSAPIEAIELNSTQIGEQFSPVIKPKDINLILQEMGLIYKQERKSTKNPERTKYFWQITEEGKKYGRVYLKTSNSSDWSDGQILWSPSVVNVIKQHLGV